ncbi:MAG: hypothetical protein ACI857_000273 [Arenicella sp.]|jgi:hypothetical protein
MKEDIFRDKTTQLLFEKDGYVKLQLLEEKEVEALREFYLSTFPDQLNSFFSSSYLNDYDLKLKVSNKISEIIRDKIEEKFHNTRLIGAAFLIKGLGKNSEMPMHQDWTIVDESKFYAANVWIPLTDTNESNGTIEVLKGSQKWSHSLRAPSLPFFFEGFQEEIKKSLTPINVKMGEVVVLNQAVIHYSKANMTDQVRPAVTCGLTSTGAPLRFHYKDPEKENQIELFEQEDDFLLRWENFHEAIYKRPPMGKSIGFQSYIHPSLSQKELDELVGNPRKKGSFLSRIFGK